MAPGLLEKYLTNLIGSKPIAIRTKNRTTFSVQLATEVAGREIMKVKAIDKCQVLIKKSEMPGGNKGQVFVYGYNMIKFEKFKKGLIAEHGLIDAIEAHWIRVKNKHGTSIVSFREDFPEYLDIPGKRKKTKVFAYQERPMMCKKYGHGSKKCREQEVCARCGKDCHDKTQCESSSVR